MLDRIQVFRDEKKIVYVASSIEWRPILEVEIWLPCILLRHCPTSGFLFPVPLNESMATGSDASGSVQPCPTT